ncbi:MAG: FAD-dependent 5-carboxymethylaminomethyl-2-thiouridine(34) oxidoreductase MnmC [Wenzhouxiangellaceae bacterium]
MQPDFEAITPALVEWRGQTPFATHFGDSYFSRDDGVGESRAVFLAGNHLPRRFAEIAPGEVFVIGETGFGTGLNMLLAAELFARTAPSGARLSLISAERHPLAPADLEHALCANPALAPFSDRLRAEYPPLTPGFHRLRLAGNIDLTLMYGDAGQMWHNQPAQVDAWFLDGFAPDRNPGMWQSQLLEALARRSRPGATLATFTVAGPVRRALCETGFEIQRMPGFGRKRHRLEGHMPGRWQARRFRTGGALIAGAGLAGATTARALAERGWQVRVLDPQGIAAGASGNRAGVVYTTPSGIPTPQNRFYQASYLHAISWFRRYHAEAAGIGAFNGIVQHITDARQRRKLATAISSGHWPAAQLQRIDDDAVLLVDGGYLRPAQWCRQLLDHPAITVEAARVLRLDGSGLPVLSGGKSTPCDAVVLCIAGAARQFPDLPALPLRDIRGQVSECRATAATRGWRTARCHEGYLTPAVDGLHCIGATFNLHDPDPSARDSDDRANLEQLRRNLPHCWRELGGNDIEVVSRRVAFRCQTRDYLPLAGYSPGSRNEAPLPLMLNLAHGSRGIGGTPLIADLIADTLSELPACVDNAMQDALDPARFANP